MYIPQVASHSQNLRKWNQWVIPPAEGLGWIFVDLDSQTSWANGWLETTFHWFLETIWAVSYKGLWTMTSNFDISFIDLSEIQKSMSLWSQEALVASTVVSISKKKKKTETWNSQEGIHPTQTHRATKLERRNLCRSLTLMFFTVLVLHVLYMTLVEMFYRESSSLYLVTIPVSLSIGHRNHLLTLILVFNAYVVLNCMLTWLTERLRYIGRLNDKLLRNLFSGW